MQAKASSNNTRADGRVGEVAVYLEKTRREWGHLLVTFVVAGSTVKLHRKVTKWFPTTMASHAGHG